MQNLHPLLPARSRKQLLVQAAAASAMMTPKPVPNMRVASDAAITAAADRRRSDAKENGKDDPPSTPQSPSDFGTVEVFHKQPSVPSLQLPSAFVSEPSPQQQHQQSSTLLPLISPRRPPPTTLSHSASAASNASSATGAGMSSAASAAASMSPLSSIIPSLLFPVVSSPSSSALSSPSSQGNSSTAQSSRAHSSLARNSKPQQQHRQQQQPQQTSKSSSMLPGLPHPNRGMIVPTAEQLLSRPAEMILSLGLSRSVTGEAGANGGGAQTTTTATDDDATSGGASASSHPLLQVTPMLSGVIPPAAAALNLPFEVTGARPLPASHFATHAPLRNRHHQHHQHRMDYADAAAGAHQGHASAGAGGDLSGNRRRSLPRSSEPTPHRNLLDFATALSPVGASFKARKQAPQPSSSSTSRGSRGSGGGRHKSGSRTADSSPMPSPRRSAVSTSSSLSRTAVLGNIGTSVDASSLSSSTTFSSHQSSSASSSAAEAAEEDAKASAMHQHLLAKEAAWNQQRQRWGRNLLLQAQAPAELDFAAAIVAGATAAGAGPETGVAGGGHGDAGARGGGGGASGFVTSPAHLKHAPLMATLTPQAVFRDPFLLTTQLLEQQKQAAAAAAAVSHETASLSAVSSSSALSSPPRSLLLFPSSHDFQSIAQTNHLTRSLIRTVTQQAVTAIVEGQAQQHEAASAVSAAAAAGGAGSSNKAGFPGSSSPSTMLLSFSGSSRSLIPAPILDLLESGGAMGTKELELAELTLLQEEAALLDRPLGIGHAAVEDKDVFSARSTTSTTTNRGSATTVAARAARKAARKTSSNVRRPNSPGHQVIPAPVASSRFRAILPPTAVAPPDADPFHISSPARTQAIAAAVVLQPHEPSSPHMRDEHALSSPRARLLRDATAVSLASSSVVELGAAPSSSSTSSKQGDDDDDTVPRLSIVTEFAPPFEQQGTHNDDGDSATSFHQPSHASSSSGLLLLHPSASNASIRSVSDRGGTRVASDGLLSVSPSLSSLVGRLSAHVGQLRDKRGAAAVTEEGKEEEPEAEAEEWNASEGNGPNNQLQITKRLQRIKHLQQQRQSNGGVASMSSLQWPPSSSSSFSSAAASSSSLAPGLLLRDSPSGTSLMHAASVLPSSLASVRSVSSFQPQQQHHHQYHQQLHALPRMLHWNSMNFSATATNENDAAGSGSSVPSSDAAASSSSAATARATYSSVKSTSRGRDDLRSSSAQRNAQAGQQNRATFASAGGPGAAQTDRTHHNNNSNSNSNTTKRGGGGKRDAKNHARKLSDSEAARRFFRLGFPTTYRSS
jgi:hypothetical protein